MFASLLLGSAPPPREIPMPAAWGEWILVVPQGSPVTFRDWHQEGYARFDGRFVLTGKYALTSSESCERLGTESCFELDIEPDPAVAARLPHFKNHAVGWVIIRNNRRILQSIADQRQRAALLAGKIPSLRGRTSVVVDQFWAGGDCEQAWYSARFVAFAKNPERTHTKFAGGFGCGY
jgi:hypothetical protein